LCTELGPAQCYSNPSLKPTVLGTRSDSVPDATARRRMPSPLTPATHAAHPCATLLADVRTLAFLVRDSCAAARHLTVGAADQPPSPRVAHAPHRFVFNPSNCPAVAQSHSHSCPLASPLPLLPLESPSPPSSGHRRPPPLELLQPHRHHQ
jgi:hypothetical protein